MDSTPQDGACSADQAYPAEGCIASRHREGLYQLVLEGFADLGITTPQSVTRSLLICDRQLVGQRFCCEGGQAIWRAAESVLEFYNSVGELRKTVHVDHFCAVRDAA